MIKVKLERYHNDNYCTDMEQTFSDLTELENWIFGQIRRDYESGMSFPTPDKAEKYNDGEPSEISFRTEYVTSVYEQHKFRIHQIENNIGIIFSDGVYTNGQPHWSKDVKEWLVHCDARQHNPQFNFVE